VNRLGAGQGKVHVETSAINVIGFTRPAPAESGQALTMGAFNSQGSENILADIDTGNLCMTFEALVVQILQCYAEAQRRMDREP